MPNLELLFNEGTATLTDSEARIYHLWIMVGKGFKPWEVEPDYGDNERIVKLEDKADLLKCDQFQTNSVRYRQKKKDELAQFGLEAGQHQQHQQQKTSLFDKSFREKKDLVFD